MSVCRGASLSRLCVGPLRAFRAASINSLFFSTMFDAVLCEPGKAFIVEIPNGQAMRRSGTVGPEGTTTATSPGTRQSLWRDGGHRRCPAATGATGRWRPEQMLGLDAGWTWDTRPSRSTRSRSVLYSCGGLNASVHSAADGCMMGWRDVMKRTD